MQKIMMKNSRNLRLEMLHQRQTYSGLLCGLPNEKMNQHLIDEAVKSANRRLFAADTQNIKVTLIPPQITMREQKNAQSVLGPANVINYPMLPSYITTILVANMDQQAVIVMFTKDIATIDSIEYAVKDLDWKEISEEFCW